jgi:selenocysteine lyase/cysteine desulfurase
MAPRAPREAVAGALRSAMANVHGRFAASHVSTEVVTAAREAVADLVGGVADGSSLARN